jgi:hypothetical protein
MESHPAMQVHQTGQFAYQGRVYPIAPFAEGTFTTCFNIQNQPGWIFKCFSTGCIERNFSQLSQFTKNKNDQYEQLQVVGIPVAETIALETGWVQEKMPYMVADLINWNADTPAKELDNRQCEILRQIREIFRTAWANRIDIDPLPRNFGYTNEGVVKLFDFREETGVICLINETENPLSPYLNQCLPLFSRGNETIHRYLDPRL